MLARDNVHTRICCKLFSLGVAQSNAQVMTCPVKQSTSARDLMSWNRQRETWSVPWPWGGPGDQDVLGHEAVSSVVLVLAETALRSFVTCSGPGPLSRLGIDPGVMSVVTKQVPAAAGCVRTSGGGWGLVQGCSWRIQTDSEDTSECLQKRGLMMDLSSCSCTRRK